MGLLPAGADILPPSDDRVFKLILTARQSEPILMDLISAIIKRPVAGVIVCNNELPPEDTRTPMENLFAREYNLKAPADAASVSGRLI